VDKILESQVFRYNEDVSVNTLDPIYIKSQSEIWIGSQIYEGLVSLNADLKPTPSLAKNWEISDSGRVYKFNLRTDIFFCSPRDILSTEHKPTANLRSPKISSPQRMNSFDVAHSLYRLLDPQNASPGAWILNDKMRIPHDLLKSSSPRYLTLAQNAQNPIHTPNDSTIILKLKRPFPAFLSLLATNFAWITPSKGNNLGTQPVGTGPFYLRRWETDVKMVLRKNPQYHQFEEGLRLPYLEAVNISFVKSKQTAFMQFMAGQYDFFNGVDATYIHELLDNTGALRLKYRSKIHAEIGDFLNTEYIGFYMGGSLNGRPNPYSDIHLRKALQSAVDPISLVKFLRNGLGTPGHKGFVPPALVRQTDSFFGGISGTPTFNLKQARNYYHRSEYFQNKQKFAALKLTTTQDYLDIAIFLQNSWKQLGVTVEIEVLTGGMLRQLRNAGKLGMFRGSWIADYPDPENYLACFYSDYKSPEGPNYTHFDNLSFDKLFENLAYQHDEGIDGYAQRQQRAFRANQMTHDFAPVLVLYYDKSVRLIQKNILGLRNDPINRLDLRKVKKLKTGLEKSR